MTPIKTILPKICCGSNAHITTRS